MELLTLFNNPTSLFLLGTLAIFASIIAKLWSTLGGGKKSTLLVRGHHETISSYLLGYERPSAYNDEIGYQVTFPPNSSPLPTSFNVTIPPRLNPNGVSNLFGLLKNIKDIVIRPKPVRINAPIELVWQVLMDFEAYKVSSEATELTTTSESRGRL